MVDICGSVSWFYLRCVRIFSKISDVDVVRCLQTVRYDILVGQTFRRVLQGVPEVDFRWPSVPSARWRRYKRQQLLLSFELEKQFATVGGKKAIVT